jgi:hypothetical protein
MGGMSENPLEIPESDAIEQLNSVRYVDLREISEPNKKVFNSLRIVVEEAVVNEAAAVISDRPELANLLAGARRLSPSRDAGCSSFRGSTISPT